MPQMGSLGATPVRLLVTLHSQPGAGMDGRVDGTDGVSRRDLLRSRIPDLNCELFTNCVGDQLSYPFGKQQFWDQYKGKLKIDMTAVNTEAAMLCHSVLVLSDVLPTELYLDAVEWRLRAALM